MTTRRLGFSRSILRSYLFLEAVLERIVKYLSRRYILSGRIGAGQASADVPEGEEEKAKDHTADEGKLVYVLRI